VFYKIPAPGDSLFFKVREVFCYYSTEQVSRPLVCISSTSSRPMIHGFALLMVSQISCMQHSYFLCILS
jgi:hypothetical protein